MGSQKKFLCPHCCRSGGKLGGQVQGQVVCDLCVKDGLRMRQVVGLLYDANPSAKGSGLPHPNLFLKLLIGWCELKKFSGHEEVVTRAREMLEAWRKVDAEDELEALVKEGKYG